MKFPSAHAGIKKIFLGALLEVIASVLVIVSVVLLALPAVQNDPASPLVASAATLALVSSAAAIVAFVFQIIGLFQAKRDDYSFANALWVILFALIANIVRISISFASGTWVADATAIIEGFTSLCDVVVIMYIVTGIANLADKVGEKSYADRGYTIRFLLLTIFVIAFVIRMLNAFFKPNPNVVKIMDYVAIVGAILELIATVWYFFYLARAPKKLSK